MGEVIEDAITCFRARYQKRWKLPVCFELISRYTFDMGTENYGTQFLGKAMEIRS